MEQALVAVVGQHGAVLELDAIDGGKALGRVQVGRQEGLGPLLQLLLVGGPGHPDLVLPGHERQVAVGGAVQLGVDHREREHLQAEQHDQGDDAPQQRDAQPEAEAHAAMTRRR